MRCKIRYLSRLRSGSVTQQEQTVDAPGRRIALGRGTDCEVFLKDLRVNYRHAEIVVRDYDIVIEAIGDSSLRVDGTPTDRGLLTPETVVEVGPYRVQMLAPQPEADLIIEVELIAPPPTDTVEKLIEPNRLQLSGGLAQKRLFSWLVFLVVITAALALPILAHRTPAPETAVATNQQEKPLFGGFDQIWSSGELSSAHNSLDAACGACHESPFIPVRKEACAACHEDIRHHFEVARFQFAGFEPTECTACHSEHQGSQGVTPTHQSLCADCHRDLSGEPANTTLLDVADFGTGHPELRPSVVIDPENGCTRRAALGAADFPKENSNLRFPHDLHLAERCEVTGAAQADTADPALREARQKCNVLQTVRQRLGRDGGLGCGDCHQPEPGGVNMLPVNMRDHCAECHRLELDPGAPGRVLPHGKPEEVIAMINDFYAAQALRTGSPIAAQVLATAQTLRRRPGGADAGAAPTPIPPTPPDPALQAQFVSAQKLESVFGRSLCGGCHEITAPDDSASGQWEVRPVNVAPRWMPKAHFNHAAHQAITLEGRTIRCIDCHEATTSGSSEDVLMPKIETCRKCHQGEHANEAIPSTCLMCHTYHRDDLAPMLPDQDSYVMTTALESPPNACPR